MMMWNYLFKSTLFRNELKHWLLIIVLFAWASLATLVAVGRKDETILIAIDQDGLVKTITDSNDLILKKEMGAFINQFLVNYYQYSSEDFLVRMNEATDMLTDELWLEKKDYLMKINEDLKKLPLTQNVKVLSIDLTAKNKVEAEIELSITTRLEAAKTKLRIQLDLKEVDRTLKHPWGYKIEGISEVVL